MSSSARLCTRWPASSARSAVSLSVTIFKEFVFILSKYVNTVLVSQVFTYLGRAGRRLKTPLKNRFTSPCCPTVSCPMHKLETAHRAVLRALYPIPCLKRSVRYSTSICGVGDPGLRPLSPQNLSHFLMYTQYCFGVRGRHDCMMMSSAACESLQDWSFCRTLCMPSGWHFWAAVDLDC